jgi:dipeptidase D
VRLEVIGSEPGIRIDIAGVSLPEAALDGAASETWLAALHASPIGVRRMSDSVTGVVETSNNLGVVGIENGCLHANLMVRSLVDSAGLALGDELASLFRLAGCAVELDGHYPGWKPHPDSPLLATCRTVYDRMYGDEYGPSKVQVIHAGLECGIIGGIFPELDMVSFGPTIHGAHAPGERVEVAAVDRCWSLLVAILDELAK